MHREFYKNRYSWDQVVRRIAASSVSEGNKQAIIDFGNFCLAEGLSFTRAVKYAELLHVLARLAEVDFAAATKADIEALMRKLGTTHYSDHYRHDLRIALKKFYKWLRKSDEYPPEVRWIKPQFRTRAKLPEELLTENEVKRMIQAMLEPRDRALLAMLYESGCRIGEIGTLQIKHVVFDEYGAYITVSGKTGMRRVRLILSVPYVATWIDLHPRRDDPDAPLWLNIGTYHRHLQMTYETIKTVLQRAGRRAGIRKRIYAHLFRHSRATVLANKLTEAQLKEMFGWTQGSRQAATYVHLSGRDVDDALLRLYGIKKEPDEVEQSPLKARVCTRCEKANPATAMLCTRCGMPLEVHAALNSDNSRQQWDDKLTTLMQDPETVQFLVTKAKQLGVRI